MAKRVSRRRDRNDLIRRIKDGGERGILAAGTLVRQRAQEIVDAKHIVDTGRLGISLHEGVPHSSSDLQFWIDIGTNVEYARAHEMGSGLYSEDPQFRKKIDIWAGVFTGKSTKRALSFKWPGGPKPHPALQEEGPYKDHYVFTHVRHPGVHPRPYLRPALRQTVESGDAQRLVLSSIMTELRI
jgi:hypothetical protein